MSLSEKKAYHQKIVNYLVKIFYLWRIGCMETGEMVCVDIWTIEDSRGRRLVLEHFPDPQGTLSMADNIGYFLL